MNNIDRLPYLIIDQDGVAYQLQIVGVAEGYRIVYANCSNIIYTKRNNKNKDIDKLDIIHYDLRIAINIILAKLDICGDDLEYRYSHPQDCIYKSGFNSSSDD